MDDVRDKLKGFMKKVNLSSSSGKFKGSGRVFGSLSSSGPVNPIQNRFNPSRTPNPNPNPTPRPKPPPSSGSSSALLPEKPVFSGSTRNSDPDPVRAPPPPQDGFDPYGALITSSNRSQNGNSLDMFECPIYKNPFTSEEEVSLHVETCIEDESASSESEKKDNDDKAETEKLVVVYLSGKPTESSIDFLLRLLKNIVKEPENGMFRKIRMSNAKIKEAIGDVPGGVELLELVGFELREENDEVWAVMETPREEQYQLINKVVEILEKIDVPSKDEKLLLVAEEPMERSGFEEEEDCRVTASDPEILQRETGESG